MNENADSPKLRTCRPRSRAWSQSPHLASSLFSLTLAVERFLLAAGLIITADEALSEEGDFAVTPPGGDSIAAQLVGRDPTTDIALLRVGRSTCRRFHLRHRLSSVGALVIAVGAEDGAPTAALGVVSRAAGPWRSLRGGEIDARIELDLRLRQSAEGGLAIEAAGRAIGMTVFGPRRRVLVIPSATVERVAARLERHGHIPRGYLGLGFQLVATEDGKRGVMVMNVEPQGPGAKAGVHQGDIIVTWNGEPMPCAVALACARPGQHRPDGHAWAAPSRRDKRRSADDRRKARHLSKSAEAGPIRLALHIADGALANRLAELLANLLGLRLVAPNEDADVPWSLLLSCHRRMAMCC